MACTFVFDGDGGTHSHGITPPKPENARWTRETRVQMADWLMSDEAVGTYTVRATGRDHTVSMIWFSDHCTAMAFKLRFF